MRMATCAFAPAGNVAFDFELGSHGGVHPDELDHFLLHPAAIEVPLAEAVRSVDLHRFLVERYCKEPAPRADRDSLIATAAATATVAATATAPRAAAAQRSRRR